MKWKYSASPHPSSHTEQEKCLSNISKKVKFYILSFSTAFSLLHAIFVLYKKLCCCWKKVYGTDTEKMDFLNSAHKMRKITHFFAQTYSSSWCAFFLYFSFSLNLLHLWNYLFFHIFNFSSLTIVVCLCMWVSFRNSFFMCPTKVVDNFK